MHVILRRPDWNACYFAMIKIDNDPFFGNAPIPNVTFRIEDGGQVRFDAGRRNELTHPTLIDI
jgi:hypothetical protein